MDQTLWEIWRNWADRCLSGPSLRGGISQSTLKDHRDSCVFMLKVFRDRCLDLGLDWRDMLVKCRQRGIQEEWWPLTPLPPRDPVRRLLDERVMYSAGLSLIAFAKEVNETPVSDVTRLLW